MTNSKKTLDATLRSIEMKYGTDKFQGMIAGAYALYLARKNRQVDIVNLKDFLKISEDDLQIRLFLLQQLEDHWDQYRKHITTFDLDVLKEFIIDMPSDGSSSYIQCMPEHFKKIVTQILNIQPTDYVADFGAGAGDFLCYAQKQMPEAQYWGDEIGSDAFAIAQIRASLIGDNHIEVVQEDMFSGAKSSNLAFDKAFCFPPFGMRLGRMPSAEKFLLEQPASLPVIKGTCSGEWLFALKMLSCLKENGRAVLVMPIGGLFNQLDNAIRRYFLERNMIEAIIKLPNKFLDFTPIPTALVVFSNKNNEKVRLIDASQLDFKKNSSDFSVEKLCTLISAMYEDKLTWLPVSFENTTIFSANLEGTPIPCISKVDYRDLIVRGNMDPAYYSKEKIVVPYQAHFEEAIEEIFRGALISSSDLDKIKAAEDTAYFYLTPAGIKDGVITDDLQMLSQEAEKYSRYSLKSGDLVITKIGAPFKVAVAEVAAGQTIVANGNVFVIRVDETKADRFYIKAFLESAKGQALLTRAAVGSAAPMLSINALKSMTIALPPLQQQMQIGAKYLAKMDEITVLKRKLIRAVDALSEIANFDSEC